MRTVLKIGGSILEPTPAPELVRAVVRATAAGEQLVLVHGGGKALTALLASLGVASRFEKGLRVTDAATLRAAVMTFAGEVNKTLVGALSHAGLRAVGLTGLDGPTVQAHIADPALGYVGEVARVDATLLRLLLGGGFTPVLAPLAADGQGGALNVNADLFAAACAGALAADRVIFVTDVAGVLDAAGHLIPEIRLGALDAMLASGALHGGMLPKMDACRQALAAGAATVEIIGAAAAVRFDDAPHFYGTRVIA